MRICNLLFAVFYSSVYNKCCVLGRVQVGDSSTLSNRRTAGFVSETYYWGVLRTWKYYWSWGKKCASGLLYNFLPPVNSKDAIRNPVVMTYKVSSGMFSWYPVLARSLTFLKNPSFLFSRGPNPFNGRPLQWRIIVEFIVALAAHSAVMTAFLLGWR